MELSEEDPFPDISYVAAIAEFEKTAIKIIARRINKPVAPNLSSFINKKLP